MVAVACKSAPGLGTSASGCGVEAYLGFDETLAWVTGTNQSQQFGKACTIGLQQMLLSNATVDQAADAMRNEFDQIVRDFKYGPGKTDPNAQLAFLWASWDKAHICLKGNPSAKL